MSRTAIGFALCFSFVTLEAFQAIYLGAVFQDVDSFLIGAWVFGISVVGCTAVTAVFRPAELYSAIRSWKIVLVLNVFAALTWSTYFIAIQLIEPAIVFTIFSGMIPLATFVAGLAGMPEGSSDRRFIADAGHFLILISVLVLALVTILGYSGFVRGSWLSGMMGVVFAALSGGFTALVILFSVRLNRQGVGPLAQFGLRFCAYTILAIIASWMGMDYKGYTPASRNLAQLVIIGLAVIAFPLYLVQRAVPLIHPSAIAAITALGPAIAFFMQLVEMRVQYSSFTLLGLTIYIAGALLAVFGTSRPSVASSCSDKI